MAGGSKVDEESVDLGGSGFGDYELVVRNFISGDKPHIPLPYTTVTKHKTISSNLANFGMLNTYDFDSSLIGTYAIGLLVRFVSTTNFMTKLEEGVSFQFYVNNLGQYFVYEVLSSKFIQPVFDGTNYLLYYYYQPNIPLPLADNPDFTVFNGSGTNLAIYITVLALDVS